MENKKLNIKEWAAEDRPREKLKNMGSEALTDAELITILIRSGNRKKTALDISKHVLNVYENDINLLAKQSYKSLKKAGLGEVAAITVVAALELSRRRKDIEPTQKLVINSSKKAAALFQSYMADLNHEEFWVAYLNNALRLLQKTRISSGTKTMTIVDVQYIVKEALLCDASHLILYHNHPSGVSEPSAADDSLTIKIRDAARLIDIHVQDHIIIYDSQGYYSFKDEGKI